MVVNNAQEGWRLKTSTIKFLFSMILE